MEFEESRKRIPSTGSETRSEGSEEYRSGLELVAPTAGRVSRRQKCEGVTEVQEKGKVGKRPAVTGARGEGEGKARAQLRHRSGAAAERGWGPHTRGKR